MKKLIFTYALIKAFWDNDGDYLECFWPLAVQAMQPDKPSNIIFIQGNLKQNLNLTIPMNALELILDVAIKRGYIEKQEDRYRLTQPGMTYRISQAEITKNRVRDKIDELISDIKQYFIQHEIPIANEDEIQTVIISFIEKNISILLRLVNPLENVNHNEIVKTVEGEYDKNDGYLITYIQNLKENGGENYEIFKDLLLGSIISILLRSDRSSEFIRFSNEKFRNIKIYLDTNFILSLFDMHEQKFNRPAKELYYLLEGFGFKLTVFSFTLAEIDKYLTNFLSNSESDIDPDDIQIKSLYNSLFVKGWTKNDYIDFKARIVRKLNDLNISIDYSNDINLSTYSGDKVLAQKLLFYKPNIGLYGLNHDLAAIEIISKIRGNKVNFIGDSKAIFLTSDKKLFRFNFKDMGHEMNSTFPEVVSDILLTNILWLIDPKIEPPIDAIIGAYSHDLFSKWEIWLKFSKYLEGEGKEEGVIDPSEFHTLLFQGYIEKVIEEDAEDAEDGNIEVTKTYAQRAVNKAKQMESEQRLRDLMKDVIDQEKERENIEHRKIIGQFTTNLAHILVLLIRALTVAFIVLLTVYCILFNNWDSLTQLQTIIFMGVNITIIALGSVGQLWIWAENWLKNRIQPVVLSISGR